MSAVNLTALLVVALAVITITFLVRKRYDSNVPLFFYFIAITFTNAFDRPVNPYIVYTGLVLALVLRFEFMGKGFTKFVAFCATTFLVMVIWDMMSVVLSS